MQRWQTSGKLLCAVRAVERDVVTDARGALGEADAVVVRVRVHRWAQLVHRSHLTPSARNQRVIGCKFNRVVSSARAIGGGGHGCDSSSKSHIALACGLGLAVITW